MDKWNVFNEIIILEIIMLYLGMSYVSVLNLKIKKKENEDFYALRLSFNFLAYIKETKKII